MRAGENLYYVAWLRSEQKSEVVACPILKVGRSYYTIEMNGRPTKVGIENLREVASHGFPMEKFYISEKDAEDALWKGKNIHGLSAALLKADPATLRIVANTLNYEEQK